MSKYVEYVESPTEQDPTLTVEQIYVHLQMIGIDVHRKLVATRLLAIKAIPCYDCTSKI